MLSTPVDHIYPYCGFVPTLLCSYIEALCQIVEPSDNYFWSYCILKDGDTKWSVYLVIDKL